MKDSQTQMKMPGGAPTEFDRAVLLRQPLIWSRAILWTLVALTSLSVIWAMLAKIDVVVSATGKLQPQGTVREIQSPVAGVIDKILVKDGEIVKRGAVLICLNPQVTDAQILSLQSVRDSLRREADYYLKVMKDGADPRVLAGVDTVLPPEMLALARDRASLLAENRLFQAKVNQSEEGIDLVPSHKLLFEAAEKDRSQRLRDASLQKEERERGMLGSQTQLVQMEKVLTNSIEIFQAYESLVKNGSVSKVDYLQRQSDVLRATNEIEKLKLNIDALRIEIAKSDEELQSIATRYRKDALEGQQKNNQQISEIDARLSKAVVGNQQRLSEIESQLAELTTKRGYQEVTAPADGIVFDHQKIRPGAVVTVSEILLKLVPSEELEAEVFLTNKDIGLVRERMAADVRIDSFPYREFGDVPGELIAISSDAMPPSPTIQYYSFPAKIRLEKQAIIVRGKPVKLQSGMAVTVNIRVRKRSVMSIFLEFLTKPVEELQKVQ